MLLWLIWEKLGHTMLVAEEHLLFLSHNFEVLCSYTTVFYQISF